MADFRPWHRADFTSELLPIIPPTSTLTAGSTVREADKGKVPGVKTQAGTWSGLGGSKRSSAPHRMAKATAPGEYRLPAP
jgi:hypothetical protein